MKIAQVIIRFLPSVGGGVQHVKHLSESLSSRGHEVDIYTSYLIDNTREALLPSEEQYLGNVKVYRCRWLKIIPGRDTTYVAPKILLDILTRSYDIVHVHGLRYFPVYGGSLLSFIKKAPVIATFHHNPEFSRNLIQRLHDTIQLKYLTRGLARIIALTNYERRWLIYQGVDPTKIVVIPNGLPSSYFEEVDKIEYNEVCDFKRKHDLEDKIRLVFVGRLSPIKNLEVIIKALRLIPQSLRRKVRLIIVGPDWGYRHSLISLAKECNVRENLLFLGKLPDREKILALRSSDIFVFPSIGEAFGIAVLEAMAARLPVLAARSGGIKEIVQNGVSGYLLNPFNPHEWAEYIIRLIEDEGLRRYLGENGRRIAEQYSWDRLVLLVEKVYKEALLEG